MSALKKFLPGKKKSKKSTSSSIKSSASEQNIGDIGNIPGYRNVKEKDLPKLHKAAWLGDTSKLKQLVKKGDVNSMDRHHRTPLHYACVKGHTDIAQWLCANRANVGICDEEGRTALMKAVEVASEGCIEILLNHGAEANVVDVNLTTPLHIAATHGSIQIATLLLERDARVNAPDNEKITPLYVAASLNFPDFVEFLLKEYASVNDADVYGRTPLIAAAMEGHEGVVKVLLHYGADKEMKDKEGWKAIDHAAMTGNHNIAELLEDQMQEGESFQAQNPTDVNFSSNVGSPFRSTSTQQSSYGGPAINITADSEDDSIGNESAKRSDFQISWADSESEFEDETKINVKVPSLANALKRNESTQSRTSLSKIPIATSKEKLVHRDEHTDESPSKSESKIPRFDPNSKKQIPKSKDDASGSSLMQSPSKIPKMVAGKGLQKHELMKEELEQNHGILQSRTSQLLGSSVSEAKAGDLRVDTMEMDTQESGLRMVKEKGNHEQKNDESETDSDTEGFSETEVLAALTGSPSKKKDKMTDDSDQRDHGKNSIASFPFEMDDNGEVKKEVNDVPVTTNRNQTDKKPNEEMLSKETNILNEESKNEESEWDSTTEEISTTKPVLIDAIKSEKKIDEEGFDSEVDSSIEETNMLSADVKKKQFVKIEDETDDFKDTKKDEKEISEFTDFSLNEKKEDIKVEEKADEKKEGNQKDVKGLKAQMEALGIEVGSSFSSFSDNESFGELDASFTQHDQIFSTKEPTTTASTDNARSDVKIEKDEFPQGTVSSKETLNEGENKSNARSSRDQYDALGIEFSEESSSETESEWEASLKKKKMLDTVKNYDDKDDKMNAFEEEIGQNGDDTKMHETTNNNIIETSIDGEEIEKHDSEFISDESFSVNTEEQLEEIEESRLKKVNEDEDVMDEFEESDFSLSEGLKDGLEEENFGFNKEDESKSEIANEKEATSDVENPKDENIEILGNVDGGISEDGDTSTDHESIENEENEQINERSLVESGANSDKHEENANCDVYDVTSEESDRNDMEGRIRDQEKAVFLSNIVERKGDEYEVKDSRKEKDDTERKRNLEAILKRPAQTVVNENIEFESVNMDRSEIQPKQETPEGQKFSEIPDESDYLDDIEEEFERRLQEKEMESKQHSNLEEEAAKKPALKDESEKCADEQRQNEIESERTEMRLEMEMKIRRHQEELRQKERDFEAELRRREMEEKANRQRQMAEREKERTKLEEKQRMEREKLKMEAAERERKKKQFEEIKRKEKEEKQKMEKEKERRRIEDTERKKVEEELKKSALEEDKKASRIIQQEIEVVENTKRVKEVGKKSSSDDDIDVGEKQKEIDELMEIERFMREQEEFEKLKKYEHLLREDDVQNIQFIARSSAGNALEEDSILPLKVSNQFIEKEISLEPLFANPNEEGEKKTPKSSVEGFAKLKQESEKLLGARGNEKNGLVNGEKTRAAIPAKTMRIKQTQSDELSDFESADVDEITKLKEEAYPIVNTPGSDAVDLDMPTYQRSGDYPAASTPYGRYDTSIVDYNDNLSPINRPKSAPVMMDENQSSPPNQSTPMALYTSLSQTGHFQDSKAFMRMQEALKESKRETERTKEMNIALEKTKREMEIDLREMQRAVEVLSRSQAEFEKLRLDMDMEVRDMKYRLDNEIKARITAEGLVSQLKEQLKRGDEKLTSEVESRQAVELAYKTLESEFKKRENLVNQYENEVNDLRFAFYHEREARINQEQIYKEQLQQHEILLDETQKTSLQHAQTLNQLEMIDQNRQSAESTANQLKVELAKTKGEFTRVNAQLEEVKATYESEISRLRNKLQEKMDELVKSERDQFQAQMQMEAEKSTSKAEQLRLTSNLENEIANKKRLQTELNVVKTQLQNATSELERVSRTKSLTESEVNKFKEESFKDRNKHDRELANSRDELQRVFNKLDSSEKHCAALESELQEAKIALAEKSGQLVMSSRELGYKANLLIQLEEKLKNEKEINNKLSAKIDNGSERSSVLRQDVDSLRKELETANQRVVDCDRAARDTQEKFQKLLAKGREDFDKEKNNLEQRIMELSKSSLRYQEERAEDKESIKTKENEMKMVHKEMNDLTKALTAAETANQIQTKNNERLEEDNARLSRQTAILEKELTEVIALKNDLEGKVEDLNEQLEHVMKVSDHANNKLAQKNNDIQHEKLSRAELEKAITRLKVEKIELESDLKEEQAKCQMVLDDLRKSNDARESLEKILANVKTTNVHLEEKLQSETLSRAQHERDAEDHKGLWNAEVKSRSRLGLQLVTMEKEIQKLKSELDDERRRAEQLEEMKRNADSRLDIYEKRTLQHQKESNAMKNKLKQYQRRIKDFENGESRIPKLYNEFERERDIMLNNSANLRRQVDSLIEQLRQEQESRSQSEANSKRNNQELSDFRAREKMLSYEKSKLEKENEMLEEELDKLKSFYERNYIEKSSLDSFKRDIETKARLEINQKLQDVNMQLEEQAAAREAYDRVRNETESKCKKELEETINGLKSELLYVKSALQEGLIKSSTYETEASRIKELYQHEIDEKQKLSEKLNNRSPRLGNERTRSIYPTESRAVPLQNGNSLFLSAERDDQPFRPGLHSSDLSSRSLMDSLAMPNLRTGNTPRDYTPIYRRNYLT